MGNPYYFYATASAVYAKNLATGGSIEAAITGSESASGTLTLNSTTNATKGKILFGASSAYDEANIRLGIGSTTPSSTLHLAGNQSQAAWGGNGIAIRAAAATYTDTSSSGVVTAATAYSYGVPTFAASSSTTFTTGTAFYVAGAAAAGTNVTITNPLAFFIDAGDCRIDDRLSLGSQAAPVSILTIGGVSRSQAAWNQNGVGLRLSSTTFTDTTSSGVTAIQAVHSILTQTVAASSSTTYTNSTTLYIAAPPTASTNVTQTNAWSVWVDSGNCRFDGSVMVGDGSVAEPAVGFLSDNDGAGTGMYRVGTNSLGFAANGVNSCTVSSAGVWNFPSGVTLASGSTLSTYVQSNVITPAFSGAGAPTIDTGDSYLYVTKIGRMVFWTLNVAYTTGGSGGNAVTITGLPYTSANVSRNNWYTGCASASALNMPAGYTWLLATVGVNSSSIIIGINGDATNDNNLTYADITGAGYLACSGCYMST